jgi:hypothetical protein
MRFLPPLFVVLAFLLPGFSTIVDGRYAKVGEHDRKGNFKLERGWTKPAGFGITPEEVAMKYGKLCKPKQACVYFADEKNYYLVADYGRPEAKSGSIPQVACPVVNGANGSLLKIC